MRGVRGREHASDEGRSVAALLALLAWLAPAPAAAWGLAAHRWVAMRAMDLAQERCPQLLAGERAALARYAVEPDTELKARFGRKEEVRHFLDLDEYGAPPFPALPRDYAEAVRRYGRGVVQERGVLPWHAGRLARRLRNQIRRGAWQDARTTAGHIAHYAADATMPLHATKNHDGQLTRQHGLHARIERTLVDAHLDDYVQQARGVPKRTPITPAASEAALFVTLAATYATVAPVLAADRAARRGTPIGSTRYYERLDAQLHALLADQLGTAAALTAALWEGACRVDHVSATHVTHAVLDPSRK